MKDQEFIEAFENCTLPAATFDHSHHVRLAWLYLQSYSVLEAVSKFAEGLKRFAAYNGKANLYHETITWAYIFLIHERMARARHPRNWQAFVAENADLFNWQESILKHYYRDETLASELARKIFVLPDKNATRESHIAETNADADQPPFSTLDI